MFAGTGKCNKNNILVAVVGLGYVGMPIAVEFDKRGVNVIGFDINPEKIENYKKGIDITEEVGNEVLSKSKVYFTSKEDELKKADFYIVAVPTPVNNDHTPDLSPVENASHIVGRNIKKNSIVVFESTVYPGVTEEICVPIIEEESGLVCGVDFKIGYSPERINPGDKIHRLSNIKKIVSGMDKDSLERIARMYEIIVDAGVHRASSIKVAEAAKVVENSQRDINIAFMNELSIIFNKMGIDTLEVLEAAGTKWNFLNFYPGLVGGHCIGVDPYYLTYRAEQLGWHSQIIAAGRRINDGIGKYIVDNVIKKLVQADINIKHARVAILGFTFKENCPDVRNTKVIDIVRELREYDVHPVIADPIADKAEAKRLYDVDIANMDDIHDMDMVIVAVAHDNFKKLKIADISNLYSGESGILFDLKGIYDLNEYLGKGYIVWRL